MINQIANIVGQAGSLWTQQQVQYQVMNPYNQQQAYQQALHGLSPAQVGVGEPLRWMFDGKYMSLKDFADAMYGDDDSAKTMFLLKHSK